MVNIRFFVRSPRSAWFRYSVWVEVGSQSEVIRRFWSWDKADDLAERLNYIARRGREQG